MGAQSGCGVAELEHVPKSDGCTSSLPYYGDLLPAIPPAAPHSETDPGFLPFGDLIPAIPPADPTMKQILDSFLLWALRGELSP